MPSKNISHILLPLLLLHCGSVSVSVLFGSFRHTFSVFVDVVYVNRRYLFDLRMVATAAEISAVCKNSTRVRSFACLAMIFFYLIHCLHESIFLIRFTEYTNNVFFLYDTHFAHSNEFVMRIKCLPQSARLSATPFLPIIPLHLRADWTPQQTENNNRPY